MISKISKLKIIEIRQGNAISIKNGIFFMYYIANLLFPGIPVPGKLQLSGKFPTLFTEWFMYGCWKRFLLYKFFDTKTFFELWVSSKLPRIHSFILSARKMPTVEKVVFDFCYCCCILLLVMPKFYLRNSSQKPSFNTTDLCIHVMFFRFSNNQLD